MTTFEISELVNFVENNMASGVNVSIESTTTTKAPKKLGLGVVLKHSVASYQVGASYENKVNNELNREGKEADFTANSLPWGAWRVYNRTIENKGKIYLRLYDCTLPIKPKSTYLVEDGARVATDEEVAIIKDWQKSLSHTSRQGTDKEVKCYAIDIEKIEVFKCGEFEYRKAADEIAA